MQMAASSVPIVPSNLGAIAKPINPLCLNEPWITEAAELNPDRKRAKINKNIVTINADVRIKIMGRTTAPDKLLSEMISNNNTGNKIQ